MRCVLLILLLVYLGTASAAAAEVPHASQGATSGRANTLSDDADDIQRQLDNEARDRLMTGKVKSVSLVHFPFTTPMPKYGQSIRRSSSGKDELEKLKRNAEVTDYETAKTMSLPEMDTLATFKWTYMDSDGLNKLSFMGNLTLDTPIKWTYQEQDSWAAAARECGGGAQSPINLPPRGLVHAAEGRPLRFYNFHVRPKSMAVSNDGRVLRVTCEWGEAGARPTIEGGAANNRRYRFHSLAVHLPSEHVVAHAHYPLETQALYVSAGYDHEAAVEATPRDPLAFLAVASLYVFANHTQVGLERIVSALTSTMPVSSLEAMPLSYIDPEFSEYACYQGSLTTPPCSESVLWLVRGRTQPVTRAVLEKLKLYYTNYITAGIFSFRHTQPRNDRPVYYFH